jgi:hypothetical protein
MNTFQNSPSSSLPAKPVSAAPAKPNPVKANDAQAVFSPEWHSSLELEPFDNTQKVRFERAIIAFLGYCMATRTLASILSAEAYLEAGAGQGKCSQPDRDGRNPI